MSLIKKVSIVLLCIMVFSFCVPGIAMAKGDGDGIGGKLLEPVVDLVLTIGDAIVSILHKVVFGEWISLLRIDTSLTLWEGLGIAGGALLAIVGIVAICAIPGIREAVLAKVTAGAIAAAIATGAATAGAVVAGTVAVGGGIYTLWNSFPDNLAVLPMYSISPEEIFYDELALFDVDFFNPKGYEDDDGIWVQDYTTSAGTTVQVPATAGQLQSIVATWYKTLRDIAIVTSMSILVYIGIRILLSSTAGDKAKYKQMIIDWVVAMCLLFVMQYIMSFSNIIVDNITKLVKTSSNSTEYYCTMEYDDKILEALDDKFGAGVWTEDKLLVQSVGGKKVFSWSTNMMGNMRIGAAQVVGETADSVGYAVCFLVLVFYTLFFTFTYLKRVLYMAFLTMIAPLVALTYPIDKINDGKAQAFNMWLKEYIFNLLIQPLHLLLYTILIVSALQLAGTNIIYSIVALGFMIPAEKLMRKFFGFEKAQTPGMLGGAAGAAMVMAGMNKLMSKGPKGGKDGSGKGSGSSDEKEDSKGFKTVDFDSDKYLAGGSDNDQEKNNLNTIDNNSGLDEGSLLNDNGMPQDGIEGYDNQTSSGIYLPNTYQSTESLAHNNSNNPPINPPIGDAGNDSPKRYTEDIIAENAKQRLQNFWNTSPQAVYARHYARQALKSKPAGIVRKGAKGALNVTKAGLGKVYNSTPIRGIRNSRTWQGTKEAGKLYAKGMANKITNKVKNGHLGRKALRMAGGAALGATAGAIGLAAGIASGDPSKAFQYGTTGLVGGYTFGSGTTNTVANALTVEGTKDRFEEGFYGEDYEQIKRDRKANEVRHNTETQDYLMKKLKDKDKLKDVNDNVLPTCVNNGITDSKEIYAVYRMKEEGIDINKGIAIAKTRKDYAKDKNTAKLGGKEHEELNKTLLLRAKKNKYVSNDEQAKQVAANTRNLLDKFSGYVNED